MPALKIEPYMTFKIQVPLYQAATILNISPNFSTLVPGAGKFRK